MLAEILVVLEAQVLVVVEEEQGFRVTAVIATVAEQVEQEFLLQFPEPKHIMAAVAEDVDFLQMEAEGLAGEEVLVVVLLREMVQLTLAVAADAEME